AFLRDAFVSQMQHERQMMDYRRQEQLEQNSRAFDEIEAQKIHLRQNPNLAGTGVIGGIGGFGGSGVGGTTGTTPGPTIPEMLNPVELRGGSPSFSGVSQT